MSLTQEVITKISSDCGINNIDELTKLSLKSFIVEKKRKIRMEIVSIFDRYKVQSRYEFEEKIKKGEISEHPAWEDLILVENLEKSFEELEQDISYLQ